jgi:nitrite reductase (NADH) small subunit
VAGVIGVAAAEHCLGPLSQIPEGEGRTFLVPPGGQGRAAQVALAVFHLRNGAVHATQAACPHRGGPLADGLLGGTTVICPLHSRKFDLSTGAALSDGCGIATFPARVTDTGLIMVDVEPVAAAGGNGAAP